MANDDRTIFDLSEEEYNDYGNNPGAWDDVTNNSHEDGWDMTHPNSDDDD